MTKKAVIYARQSTSKQQSIPAQMNALVRFAREHDMKVLATFQDALSGKDTTRDGFNAMKEYLSHQSVDSVLVWRYDRIARNLIDLQDFLTYCIDLNINVVSMNEHFGTNQAHHIWLTQILGAFGQYHREVIKENQHIAYHQKHRQGKILSANVSYGYRLVEGELELQAEEAMIVKEIFDLYVKQKLGYKAISEHLNSSGKLNRDNKWWHATRIKAILDNPFYTGSIQSKYGTNETHALPLVELELFEKVSEIQNSRNALPQRVTRRYVLQGKIKCPHCQTVCTPSHTHNGQRDHYYYRCSLYISGGKRHCPGLALNALDIEQHISSQLHHFIHSTSVAKDLKAYIGQSNQEIERINKQKQAKLKERELKLLRAFEQDTLDDNQLSEKLRTLKERQEKLTLQPPIPESILELLDHNLRVDINPTLNQYTLYQSIIDWIEVDEDKQVVGIYLNGFTDNILEEEFYAS